MALFDNRHRVGKKGPEEARPRIYRMMVEALHVDPRRLASFLRDIASKPHAGAGDGGNDHHQSVSCAGKQSRALKRRKGVGSWAFRGP